MCQRPARFRLSSLVLRCCCSATLPRRLQPSPHWGDRASSDGGTNARSTTSIPGFQFAAGTILEGETRWSDREHALPVLRDYTSANPLHAHDCASRKLSPLLSFVGSLHHDRVAVHGRFLAHHKGGCLAILEAHVEPHLRINGRSFSGRMKASPLEQSEPAASRKQPARDRHVTFRDCAWLSGSLRNRHSARRASWTGPSAL